MAINICFSTTDRLFSRIIRWFSKSSVSHALITFRDDTLGKVFVMEANGRGFMLSPWAKWRKGKTLIARYSLDCDESCQLSSLRALANELGAEYDYRSFFGFLLRRWFRRMANPFSDPDKLFCSEAVTKFVGAINDQRAAIFSAAETWLPGDLLGEAGRNTLFVLEESNPSP